MSKKIFILELTGMFYKNFHLCYGIYIETRLKYKNQFNKTCLQEIVINNLV